MGQVIHSDMVKRALRNLGTATPAQVSAELEIEDAPGKLQVRGILRDLKKSGGAERDAQGQYRLVDDPSRRGGVQAKLWEFMCLRFGKAQPWTTRDAAKRAECNWDYTKRYTQFLAGEKVVEPVGQEGNAVLYRVIPGMEKAPAPHWNRRAETRRKGPSLDDYAGKPLPEDHPGRELIIHSLAAEPVSPPPPPPQDHHPGCRRAGSGQSDHGQNAAGFERGRGRSAGGPGSTRGDGTGSAPALRGRP